MWHSYDVSWGWWLVMTVGMVAFWGLVIYGVVWLVRGAGATASPKAESTGPLEPPLLVLKRRLAAGEITVEEYEALRAVLDDAPAEGRPAGVG